MSSDVSLVSRHCTLNYINLVKYIQSQHREEKCLSCAKRLHIWLVMVSKERREEVMRVMTERVVWCQGKIFPDISSASFIFD